MYKNISVNLSDEWIAAYAEKQGVDVETVLTALREYEEDFRKVLGDVKTYCDDNIDIPYLFDYLPKRVLEDSRIHSFDPKILQEKIDARELARKQAIRKQHDEIRKRMTEGRM